MQTQPQTPATAARHRSILIRSHVEAYEFTMWRGNTDVERGKGRSSQPWNVRSVDKINVEDLITEIEAHPAIWDSSLAEYSDNVATERAWIEVCSRFDPDFAGRDAKEKNLLGKYRLIVFVIALTPYVFSHPYICLPHS